MTPALRAAWSVAIRLPDYVAVARLPGGRYREQNPRTGFRALPRRVWRAFKTFHAIEARR